MTASLTIVNYAMSLTGTNLALTCQKLGNKHVIRTPSRTSLHIIEIALLRLAMKSDAKPIAAVALAYIVLPG